MIRVFSAVIIACGSLLLPVPSQAADKLSVLLEWFVNPDHAPMVIARERGLFADANLEVELIPPSDPSVVPRLVSTGEADIGIHYQPNLFLDHDAGLPLVRFGTLVETPLNTITVLADGPIKSLKDLKGKKVGYSVSGFEQAMLKKMLQSEGVSSEDVELINVNFSLSPSLIGGRVDATLGGFRNFELTQMKLEGKTGRAFFPEEHGVPPYDELIYVTRRDLIGDERLPRFLSAVEQASIFLTNHPQEGWELFIKAYPNLDDELNKTAFFETLPRFAKRPAALDRGRYARFGAFMQEMGLIKATPQTEDVAVEIR
ncbi:ABC transporter substrate-binding protein [Rhizobium sp. NTR19]|uniref:ABC transporter substrate-binding protein n=1 Tax=Neorhizobium turbinariae TaxID=2937795 RepID=A0ABT0IN98_9HYPH|nr:MULTISPECIES: ABC transporter substrate-binding protein [Neorhizobium]MCK8779341.1 ABC transporter substrate-binding protein [Neorhizobium turbinariae]